MIMNWPLKKKLENERFTPSIFKTSKITVIKVNHQSKSTYLVSLKKTHKPCVLIIIWYIMDKRDVSASTSVRSALVRAFSLNPTKCVGAGRPPPDYTLQSIKELPTSALSSCVSGCCSAVLCIR